MGYLEVALEGGPVTPPAFDSIWSRFQYIVTVGVAMEIQIGFHL